MKEIRKSDSCGFLKEEHALQKEYQVESSWGIVCFFDEEQGQPLWSTVGDESREITGDQMFQEFPINIWEESSNT